MMQSHDIKSVHMLNNQPTILKFIEILLMLIVVAYFDLITGFEISCFVLYALPLVFGVLLFNVSVGIFLSILATIIWVWTDLESGHDYSSDWIIFVNALNRLGFFLLTALATEMILRQRRKTGKPQVLSNVIKVCQLCHKSNLNHTEWLSLETFLQENNRAKVYSSYCADCARSHYASSGIFSSLIDRTKQD